MLPGCTTTLLPRDGKGYIPPNAALPTNSPAPSAVCREGAQWGYSVSGMLRPVSDASPPAFPARILGQRLPPVHRDPAREGQKRLLFVFLSMPSRSKCSSTTSNGSLMGLNPNGDPLQGGGSLDNSSRAYLGHLGWFAASKQLDVEGGKFAVIIGVTPPCFSLEDFFPPPWSPRLRGREQDYLQPCPRGHPCGEAHARS